MLDRKLHYWFVAIVAVLGVAVTHAPAEAGGKNSIRAIAIADEQGTTTIRAQGGDTPTFTVYKLERPTRVVVDIAQATLAEAVRGDEPAVTYSVGSWAVGQVAAMAVEDGSSTVRVIVTLARPGRYDVKAVGQDVVIKVTARDAAPKTINAADLASAQAQAEQARKDADASRAAALRAQAEADASRAAVEAALRQAAADKAAADKAKLAADKARAEANGSKAAIEAAQKAAAEQKAAADRATAAVERARAEVERNKEMMAEAQRLAAEQKAAVERAQAAADKARAEADGSKAASKAAVDDARREAAAEKAAADQAREEAQAARREAEKMKADATRALAEAAAEKAAADKARADADRARTDAATAQAAAAKEAERARTAQAAATAAQTAASKATADDRTRAERQLAEARAEADKAKAAAAAARAAADKFQAEARAAQAEAERSLGTARTAQAQADRELARARTAQTDAEREVAKARTAQTDAEREAAKARSAQTAAARDLEEARASAAGAREAAERELAMAKADRADLDRQKAALELERKAAADAKKQADAAIASAQRELAKVDADAKAARAAQAAAAADRKQAEDRERAALAAADKAAADKAAAEEAMQAAAAMKSKAAGSDATRARAADVAVKDAEARLAKAEKARAEAEKARASALAAADSARAAATAAQDTLAQVETARGKADRAKKQAEAERASAEAARAAAEQRRADTVAAVEQAEARRAAAEKAAADAKATQVAEEKAAARAHALREAEDAAAEKAAVAAARALARKQAAEAEASRLEAALAAEQTAAATARKRATEQAAADEAAAAAVRRHAADDEIAAAKADAKRLAAERAAADRDLVARRKEVADHRSELDKLTTARAAAAAEVDRLNAATSAARDARAGEEARLAEVQAKRAAEEKALAALQQDRVAAAKAATTPPPAPAAAPAKAGARVSAIRFAPDGDDQTVTVALDGKGASAELAGATAGRTELIVHGASLPADQSRTLDATRFGGPIKTISSYTDPAGVVRVVVAHSGAAPQLDVKGGAVQLRFAGAPSKVTTQTLPSPVVGGFGATSAPITQTSVAQLQPKRKIYRGATIDLDFKDADIHDLLRTLATVGRVNIVVPDEIRATVTVQLKRVPWDQALEVILESKGLWYRKEGNLYRIADRKLLDAEDEAAAARLKALIELEHPEPKVHTLNYASAADLAPLLNPLLSPKGKIEVDARTNSLIVNDVARSRQDVIDLARSLDTQTPQISIEARIVEASSNFTREFGIQWGGRALAGAAGGNATGLIFPSSIGVQGGANVANTQSDGVAAPSDFAVNLPTTLTGGAIGLSLGSVGGNFNINLRLTAMEQQGTVRIISAPKVTVLNNVAAHMGQGIKVPVQTTSAQGTQTEYKEASLNLDVTPYVSQSDCAIVMDVKVAKDEFNFVRQGARGDPTIETRTANTRILVNDGETSVMGGIYTRNTGVSYRKIPVLGDVPVFGWLFKSRQETDTRGELLIFITPKITNRANLRCGAD